MHLKDESKKEARLCLFDSKKEEENPGKRKKKARMGICTY
jgi:hypothetical protein